MHHTGQAGVKEAGPPGTVSAALAHVIAPVRMRSPREHVLWQVRPPELNTTAHCAGYKSPRRRMPRRGDCRRGVRPDLYPHECVLCSARDAKVRAGLAHVKAGTDLVLHASAQQLMGGGSAGDAGARRFDFLQWAHLDESFRPFLPHSLPV